MQEAYLQQPQTVMEQIGTRQLIEIIDLLPGFKKWTSQAGQPLYLAKDGHWNEYGHSLAAKIVAEELLRRKVIDSSARSVNSIEAKMTESKALPTN
jgi:hypothetical protein